MCAINVGMIDVVSERIVRRNTLIDLIKQKYPGKTGKLFLCADFERHSSRFLQDSTFHYFFGIDEPAVVAMQDINAYVLNWFTPSYATDRNVWCVPTHDAELLATLGVEKVEVMGDAVRGYSFNPWCVEAQVKKIGRAHV